MRPAYSVQGGNLSVCGFANRRFRQKVTSRLSSLEDFEKICQILVVVVDESAERQSMNQQSIEYFGG